MKITEEHSMSKMIRVAAEAWKNLGKDEADVAEVCDLLRSHREARASGVRIGEMEWVVGRTGISRRRVYALLRKHLPQIVGRVGAVRGTYWPACTTKSGRGEFGRLGGAGRSRKDSPRLRVDWV